MGASTETGDVPPQGTTSSGELTMEELQLATRNHGMPLEALRYDVTAVGLHYLLIHDDVPAIDPQSWRLRVHGLVDRETEFGLDELRSLRAVRASGEGAEMAMVTVNGVGLAYEISGTGEIPLVMVHGSWSSRREWDPVVPQLAESFRVLTFDRRGHSESERPSGPGSVRENVADLAALIEHLELAPDARSGRRHRRHLR